MTTGAGDDKPLQSPQDLTRPDPRYTYGEASPSVDARVMGVKGLSKAVIKQAWHERRLADLPAGTRVGIDAMGWLHRAVVTNARDICMEKTNSTSHHGVIIRLAQQLLHHRLAIMLVIDGRAWPLKRLTASTRINRRSEALQRADEAVAAQDWKTADKYYKQAVPVPDQFISWVIQHFQSLENATVVVANYEADAQLAQLKVCASRRGVSPLRFSELCACIFARR